MTEEFVASNGITLGVDNLNGKVRWRHGDDSEWHYVGEMTYGLGHKSNVWNAIEEWVRAKEDERLGRFRYGQFLVYPDEGPDDVMVVDETAPDELWRFARDSISFRGDAGSAARTFFDAHPEPKPWYDAAEGEVWELEFKAGTHAWFVNGPYFQSTKTLTNIYKTDPDILSARKIWPQDD